MNTIQKPEKLIERLVKASSMEGDLVLDPFSGVGTCLSVCKRLGRRYIGIEKNEEFVRLSKDRLDNANKQISYDVVREQSALLQL